MKEFDLIIIGAGPAGYKSAYFASKYEGLKIALIEKEELGGTCLNWGCIPAKSFLEGAKLFKYIKNSKEYGFDVEFKSFDIEGLKAKTKTTINTLKSGINSMLKGVEFIKGEAKFLNENEIKVGDELLRASKFIIATGSSVRSLPNLNVDKKYVLSSDEIFDIKELPKSILIVGGGTIGCEFASFFSSLGTKVYLAEYMKNLVFNEDEDISKALAREFSKNSIDIFLDSSVHSYKILDDSIEVLIKKNNSDKEDLINVDKILLSVGRVPNTKSLDLAKAGVDIDRGFVEVDKHFFSSKKHIVAIGDIIKTPALAHKAYKEAKVAVKNLIEDKKEEDDKLTPYVTFSFPEIASIGLKEKEAKEKGLEIEIKKIFFKSNAKAKIVLNDGGFIKIIIDKNTKAILGGSIIGENATELIHQILIACETKLSLDDLKDLIFAHPTISENITDI